MFFDLNEGISVNSTVYRDQVLSGPLIDFWEESFGDIDNSEPIVMKDNAPVHKKVCVPYRAEIGMKCWQHLRTLQTSTRLKIFGAT